jgi:hypothetical protein
MPARKFYNALGISTLELLYAEEKELMRALGVVGLPPPCSAIET